MPCILAECWITRSNRLARERIWHPAWALVQMGAASTLVSLLKNNRKTNGTHITDTRRDQRSREEQRNKTKIKQNIAELKKRSKTQQV